MSYDVKLSLIENGVEKTASISHFDSVDQALAALKKADEVLAAECYSQKDPEAWNRYPVAADQKLLECRFHHVTPLVGIHE